MPKTPLVLEYRTPARDWEREALPIGNGRLGAMLLGKPESAEFQFNVDSLWTGGENPSGEYDATGFGQYQAFGTLRLALSGLGETREYARELDLGNALHVTRFRAADGTAYVQEAFASNPAEVIAIRLSATAAKRISGALRLEGAHGETSRAEAAAGRAARLSFAGTLQNGLAYEARVALVAEGCEPSARGAELAVDGCDALTLYLAAATNYALDPRAGFRGPEVGPRLERWLDAALAAGFERLRSEHVADHRGLFDRVAVDFGATPREVLSEPVDVRIASYEPGRDPELAALIFQYGRYLLIASSRDNGLPANLQGIWNRTNEPPWHSDYHTNINIQMNYWLAEPANLSECHRPLFRLLDAMIPQARAATRAAFGADVPGFTYRTSHNIFGGQGWEWNTPASAWYALHYFEHFAFTGDREFLERQAFPYLREVSEFWLHRLKRREDGSLVAPGGWSPEHGPREDGVSYDQQLVWELFSATLEAGAALGGSDPILARVAEARKRLLGPKIGKWGQLQEWIEDRDDPEDRHRHTSHLVGVYPGRQISLARTPEWARAAQVSLRARGDTGDSRRSWTWPWRCALWARLGTTGCHRMIDGYVEHNLLPNLIATHPPLQLDGNFGMTAGISEMLLQSHAGEIALLPGLDRTLWPDGSFRGLCARGGFEVDARWSRGALVEVEIASLLGRPVDLRAPARATRVGDASGAEVTFTAAAPDVIGFATRAGERYRIAFATPAP